MQSNRQQEISRRKFVKCAVTAAALPTIVSSNVFGANAPSNQITLGLIGTGIHGGGWNLDGFRRCKDARILAVCDVMESRREATRAKVNQHHGNNDCTAHADWREIIARPDIDAVMISTPDHWHVPMAAAASKAGKDVCCEKPTLTIAEGRALVGIIRENNTVFQTSTEDRSIPVYHRMAELVRNGRIGRLQSIRITLPSGGVPPESPRVAPVPKGFDYDMWLGPAPEAPYCTNRCGAQQWRNIFDYSGGKFTDWGAHMLDTAQWANDTERTTPVKVDGTGVFPDKSSIYTAANDYKLHYRYANGVDLHVSSGGTGIRMEGSDGWLEIPAWRKPLEASSQKILNSVIGPDETQLFTCPQGEHRNFLDCVKSRKDPYFPVEVGHAMATLMHIGNISMRLDRPLEWDPDKEAFVNDAQADRMRSREMRKPWTL
ncbi:MAG: Gfo/Idh/MocA family oxidoreductase [Fuerstiella sp.]|nr:Gfo/Idh/MocA family oxidoreductase [Fuerstiella sp.]MCP4853531.1 Gfo/Idh/MocA family oxidoreductase [Fuerstiella sp.]